MHKKILVIGGTGMLGHVVYFYLRSVKKFEVYNSVFQTKLTNDSVICDVKNFNELDHLFSTVRPQVVINCVGALVKESQLNPESAIYLNALLPHRLKNICDNYQAKLVHISTDCVFSGKDGSYHENDFRDADDVYGRSKALGEVFKQPHLTLRTSIIGPELKTNGIGLFHWFMQQTGQINGYTNVFWGGVTTLELAKAIHKAIDNELWGLLHVTNGERISKFDMLCMFNAIWRRPNLEILIDSSKVADKSLQKSSLYNFNIPSYQIMMNEMHVWMNEHEYLYHPIYKVII